MLCLFDLRTEELQRRIKLSGLGAVSSVLCHPSQPTTVYAAAGCGISEVDLRQASAQSAWQEVWQQTACLRLSRLSFSFQILNPAVARLPLRS